MKLVKRFARSFAAISMVVATCATAVAQDGIVLVANIDQPMALNREQVRNLYMGGKVSVALKPVALSSKHRNRVVFNTKVIGLTESRIHSYWAQMRFTGRGKPPQEFDEIESLISHLQETPGAVGYLPAGITLPAELVVLYSTVN